ARPAPRPPQAVGQSPAGLRPRRPSAPRPWAAAGRVTVTKHFLGFGFCLVIVFQETTPSRRRWPQKPQRPSAPAPPSGTASPSPPGLLGPERTHRAVAARSRQPRALLSGVGHPALRGRRLPSPPPPRPPSLSGPPLKAAAAMGTDSRAAGALLARASTLHLQTGNLLNWGRLRKKCPSTHSEELRDCIQKTLNEWSSQISPDLIREFPDVLECTVSHAVEKINPDEREEMKVSAKLFIVGSNSSSSTRSAVDMACSVLGVAQLDSVIIASPPIEDGVNLSLEHLQPYWEELENLVQSKKIVAIGTSDLDKTQLEQLYQWAQVKPNSNQVNLASCCVMPPDLTAFAKQFDIQLLTHNDPKELLSEASFQEALQESIPDIEAQEWVPLWLLRYSVIVKSRGIIKSKGYILQAKRRGS
ncbi:Glutamate--cysteine ligase regulatory subunit, partial [Lemmus lemmus]